jgi:uncharacterized protein YndB with AHSA1/START domain
MSEARSEFVYVTYIQAEPQRVFAGLTEPEFTRAYWDGVWHDAEWRAGGSWKLMFPDGRVADSGEVVEYDPPRRLVLKWRNEFKPELREEGYSRCEITLEPDGPVTKLTIHHSIDRANAKLIEGVSNGWPRLMASLKSLLETGAPLPTATTGR